FASADFLQVNPAVNDKMIDQALSWLALDKSDNVLDLFCGLGNFTLPIAPYVNHIIGVEGIEKMVAQATANATRNNLTNAQFFRADLSKDLSSETWLNKPINKIILDPPRTGAYELLKQLPATATDILYISCEPSALARDAELLTQKGYSMVRFGVMDMFPQTNHVESMALFQKTTKGKSS
uniref:23S rRNA (uracil(1939)-C(5))-methyltransferase RlmD n=1 Tax=Neptunomonas phycophila TaxID=1572645 RepID=UPI0023FA347A